MARLHATPGGLTAGEARRRLSSFGVNEPAPARGSGMLRLAVSQVANPLALILLAASSISIALGEVLNASIIILMVLLSSGLNLYQTYRSQKAADRLKEEVALLATVLRDGRWQEVPRRIVVPGDIIRLSAGMLVPADARLLTGRDIHVQQAALTGESLPTEKDPDELGIAAPGITEAKNTVFLGTAVVSGMGTAVVFATGRATEFGEIAERLTFRAPESEFERGIREFSLLITRTILLLVLFVFVMSLVLRHDTLESLLFVVALAVGLTPEFLPMITAVTLAQGALRMAKHHVIVKNLASLQNFGSIDVLCSDKTGTLTSGEFTVDQAVDYLGHPAARVLTLAALNSRYETGIRSILDEAILRRCGPQEDAGQKIDEIPFDFDRRRLSVVVDVGGERLLITKGAPESVFSICQRVERDGRSDPFVDAAADCAETFHRLSGQGLRVVAVAYRTVPEQPAYRADDEEGLTLAGFVSFIDPPLDDADETIQAMHDDGVEVKILTGDNELVTTHICARVGIAPGRVVLGNELDRMSDPALAHLAEQTTIFARVSPAQKSRIILALRSRNHVVGYIGDGINDAPSLHAADVGISVSSAVEVAKDAADIILAEHRLEVLHNGIIEGRKAFGNIMKYLLMGTSSAFGNMFSMAGAAVFLPFLPMLPTQILLNNFLYDIAQVTIPSDAVDPSFVHKPRRWDIQLIKNFMLVIGPISSLYDFLTFAALLFVFQASEALFHTGWFVESLATQTLVIFVIRTAGPFWRSRPSLPLTVTTILIVAIGVGLPFSPLAQVLGFTALPPGYFLFLVGAACTYLVLVEIVKRRLFRRMLDAAEDLSPRS